VQKIFIEIVIEIGTEQTRLFQYNRRFHWLCRFLPRDAAMLARSRES